MMEGQNNQNSINVVSLEEMVEAISAPKLSRLSLMARAEICPKIKRARLMSTKGVAAKIREQYGYEISNTTFLHAEETVYLIELGKLEINLGRIYLSVERARAIFLHSKSNPADNNEMMKIKTCSVDEYMVYKHLSELGYRVRRRDSDVKIINININQSSLTASRERLSPMPPQPIIIDDIDMNVSDEGNRMEFDNDEEDASVMQVQSETDTTTTTYIPQSHQQQSNNSSSSSGIGKSAIDNARGTKRKIGEVSFSDQTPGSTTSKDVSDDDDEADEELDFVHNNLGGGGDSSCMDGTADNSFFHPTSSTSTYTVTEADSDVEISEEPEIPTASVSGISSGVHIEEIGYGYDGDIEDAGGTSQEPQPSTSAACFSNDYNNHALVDLADSDSDNENVSSFIKVFNKFVPNSTIQIGFPPQVLLPSNITMRDSIYEFDLKSRENNRSDSDLEIYVDELTLNPSPIEQNNSYNKNRKHNKDRSSYNSWKEWRQGAVTEAQDILSESLLGHPSTGITEDTMQKLHLWDEKEPKCKRKADEGWRGFNIPYELYHPSIGFTKYKNRKECPPSYVVAVVRNDDEVPSFLACDSLVNGVPVLIAMVSDESTIMFMNPDGSRIPSLF